MQEHIATLLEAVKTGDESLAHNFKKTEEWATVEEMMAAHGSTTWLYLHKIILKLLYQMFEILN